jgi:kynurenine formamidase
MPYPEAFYEIARRVNNWGRWGADDEIGTINLITPDVVRHAASLVRTGKTFALGLPLSQAEGIQVGVVPGRVNPLRTMIALNTSMTGDPRDFCTSDDVVTMALQAATHWDGLGHATYDNRLWNGFGADTITVDGATKCGIHKIKTLLSRGVLLDVARARGVERLDPNYPVRAEDLDAAAEFGKVEIRSGDVILVRTGQMQHVVGDKRDLWAYVLNSPGLTVSAAEWNRQHDVAAVANDTLTFENFPAEDPEMLLPVHLLHLVEMGLTQGQNWNLEALAADCADDGVYEFLLDATPQPFTNAVGTPVNPVAVK